jgi:class 3 adenylate cyclase
MTGPVVVVREPGRVPLHLVVREPLEVGRDCAGLLVDDAQVSRRHIELRPDGGRVYVTDLGSSNGTFLDGVAIDGAVELTPGHTLRIGDTVIERSEDGAVPAVVDDRSSGRVLTSIDRVAAAVQAEPPVLGDPGAGGTRTIVFSDIEESTTKALELGDQRWFEVLSSHNAIIEDCVAAHGGTVVKTQGDGFMLAFDSARGAVRCMVDVQRRLAANVEADPSTALRVRVGVHTGEAVEDPGGDLFGRAVIVAARVANEAGGGEILVSSLVREIIEPRGDIRFGPSREVHLKGITGIQLVHPIDWQVDWP